jgi:glycosyltransferase involved in cell wall biosynthesis
VTTETPKTTTRPDLSFVMPCFNEEEVIGYTIPQFVSAFEKAGVKLELVAVDNGSSDGTGSILRELAAKGLPIVSPRVEVNQGYGFGVLTGIQHATAPWIGIIPADGQVDAEDVVRLFEAVRHVKGLILGKVRRRFRMDGLLRKIVSVAYNSLVKILWPRLRSIDINGSPKILQREVLRSLDLQSKDWFLDPEMMVKSHYLGVGVLEMNVFARMRGSGLSHVRASTCIEFFTNLLRFRFSRDLKRWRERARERLAVEMNSKTDPAPVSSGSR